VTDPVRWAATSSAPGRCPRSLPRRHGRHAVAGLERERDREWRREGEGVAVSRSLAVGSHDLAVSRGLSGGGRGLAEGVTVIADPKKHDRRMWLSKERE
jgi:hypothetical protein